MADLPRLTENKIRQWTAPRSFNRGLRYYKNGYIVHPRIQGSTLKAQCRGSRPTPYRVEVTLDAQGIRSGHCSCPVGKGGHCKHAVALLLTWMHEPERFVETEPLDALLEQRSKEELIVLIQRMLRLHPELEEFLALPVPGGSQTGSRVDPAAIQRQVANALDSLSSRGYYDWHTFKSVYEQLMLLVETGDACLQQDEWENAVTVYDTVMRAILAEYELLADEDGDIVMVVNDCVAGLGCCLEQAAEPSLREKILAGLFHVYRSDMELGRIGLGDGAVDFLVENTTPEERRLVARWVEEIVQKMEPRDDFFSRWRREIYGGLLLSLQGPEMDDETFLAICRETGRYVDLAIRLLELERAEEAKEAARSLSDHELIRVGDVFWEQGHRELAEELVRERASQTPQSKRMLEWLAARAEERGDLPQALAFWQVAFRKHPALGLYGKVRELAQKLGTWEEVVSELLIQLAKAGQFYLLTEIFLEEGQVEQALDALRYISRPRLYGSSWHPRPLELQVAEAAEAEFPQEAIRIYVQMAEELIAARGRTNYAQAAGYLKRTRDIYRRLGQEATWQALITRIRAGNKTLRALKDELKKAGL